jgi:hypothetical protein
MDALNQVQGIRVLFRAGVFCVSGCVSARDLDIFALSVLQLMLYLLLTYGF